MGKTSQAISCLEKALQVNPGCVDALINIGQIFQERGEMKKAEETFTRALSIQSDSIAAYYHLAGLNANFDRRSKIYKISDDNIDMVQTARSVGACAKFTGSGGAIVGLYKDEKMYGELKKAFSRTGIRVIKPKFVTPRCKGTITS